VVATSLFAATVLSATVASAEARRFAVGPEPAWVQPLSLEASLAPSLDAGGGVSILLSDQQVYVGHEIERTYFRLAEKVRSSEGLERVSHLSLDFAPAYEHLTIHYIRVLRGGRTINALKPNAIKVIQAERDLAEEQYNGELTALVVVDDLRVGDVLDYAYSLEGANQILGGHLASHLPLGFSAPIERLRSRLVVADQRPIFTRPHGSTAAPVLTQHDGVRDYSWTSTHVPAVEHDDQLPVWLDPNPWVQVTDFSTWNEVARWASGLFAAEPTPSPELAAQIEAWRKLPTENARIEAALAFVRNEVRYFGVELGHNSHAPHPPSEVFQKRFGDCKDKAFLLVAILRSFGVDAKPALTNTTVRRTLDHWLPSAQAFNHVIVRVQLGTRTLWLDPTRRFQRGTLAHLSPLPYERALVADERTTALSELVLPPPTEPELSVDERYSLGDGQVEFDVVTRYRGDEAERMRGWLADHSPEQMEKHYLNYYAKRDPEIQSRSALVFEDDSDTNTITASEHYRLAAFWKKGTGQVGADIISGALARPNITRRTTPFSIGAWRHLETHIRIDLPDVPKISGARRTIADDALRFTYASSRSKDGVLLEYDLYALADSVPPEMLAQHLSTLDGIDAYLGYELTREPAGGSDDGEGLLILGFVVGLALTLLAVRLVVVRVRARLRRRRIEKRVAQSPGEAPATALLLSGPDQIAREVSKRACGCPSESRTTTEDEVLFDGRVLTVVRLQCASCGLTRRYYFAIAASAQTG